jgi:hypothetical protein
MTAAERGDLALAWHLLELEIPVPRAALDLARTRGDSQVVEVMLFAGADPDGP